ncbi:MAG: rhodanese-like domain-containing protein [Alphaproteobacteria bacterium]|nr:rhodanese-like domain-containing protein [Alphaproteobacteria bacterium]
MYAGYKKTFGDVPDVTATEAQALLADGRVLLVDVREPQEREVSTLPGAVTPDELAAHPEEAEGKVVVAYCTIGYRSGQWAKEQREKGLDVRNLAGSVLAWTHAGGPLVHDGEPTRKVHVYGATWNLARSDYEAVW